MRIPDGTHTGLWARCSGAQKSARCVAGALLWGHPSHPTEKATPHSLPCSGREIHAALLAQRPNSLTLHSFLCLRRTWCEGVAAFSQCWERSVNRNAGALEEWVSEPQGLGSSSDLKSLLGVWLSRDPCGVCIQGGYTHFPLPLGFPMSHVLLSVQARPGLSISVTPSPNLPTLLRAFASQFNTVSQATSGTRGLQHPHFCASSLAGSYPLLCPVCPGAWGRTGAQQSGCLASGRTSSCEQPGYVCTRPVTAGPPPEGQERRDQDPQLRSLPTGAPRTLVAFKIPNISGRPWVSSSSVYSSS